MASLYVLISVAALLLFLRLLFPAKQKRASGAFGASRPDSTRQRGNSGTGSEFHAVSIRPPVAGCPAVEAIRGERFLSVDAPSLPIYNCTASSCNCRYVHHFDRRGVLGNRRADHDVEEDSLGFVGALNRRVAMGRRNSDWPVLHLSG